MSLLCWNLVEKGKFAYFAKSTIDDKILKTSTIMNPINVLLRVSYKFANQLASRSKSLPSGEHLIFNPFLKENFSEDLKHPLELLKGSDGKEIVINNYRMGGDGHFLPDESKKSKIYFYKISGLTAGFYFNGALQVPDKANSQHYAIAFFHSKFNPELPFEYDQVYFVHNLGSVTNEKLKAQKDKNWFFIPRELFKSVTDYVYMAVCATAEPQIYACDFPQNRPFYWELPVATAAALETPAEEYGKLEPKGKQLASPPTIVLGRVKYLGSMNPPMKPVGIIENDLPCVFRWTIDPKNTGIRTDYPGNMYVENLGVDVSINCSGDRIANSLLMKIDTLELPVNVYINNNKIKAFVWESGNEDDLVQKTCSPGENFDSYKDSNLLSSLSIDTIYGSYISLTTISPAVAARYVVRTLASQPVGARCLSIDAKLGRLMGGALIKIIDILKEYKKAIDTKNGDILANKTYAAEIMKWIYPLLSYNGSVLFYDSPVDYSHPEQFDSVFKVRATDEINEQVKFYLQDVLGIQNGSNGCQRLKEHLLSPLFQGIKKLGIQVDYVYCDIERIWNDARMLDVNRFNYCCLNYLSGVETKYQEGMDVKEWEPYNSKELMDKDIQNNVYNTLIKDEITEKKNGDLLEALKLHGYYSTDKNHYLNDIINTTDDFSSDGARYGISKDSYSDTGKLLSYAQRRNLNVWDVVMKNYENSLYREYVFQPVWDAFPDAVCSAAGRWNAKGYINCADRFETYLGGNVDLGNDKWHSCCTLYDNYYSKGNKKLSMDNWKIFPKVTPFSFFMDHIQRLQATFMALNDFPDERVMRSATKMCPFITSWNIWANYLNQELGFMNSKNGEILDEGLLKLAKIYHRELMYHTFMCLPDKAIAYFNKPDAIDGEKNFHTKAYKELNDILDEMNRVVPIGEYYISFIWVHVDSIIKDVTNLPFVISRIVDNGSKAVCRITFCEKPLVKVVGRTVTFKIGKYTLTCNARIDPEKDSDGFGYWLYNRSFHVPKITVEADWYRENPAFPDADTDTDTFKIVDPKANYPATKPYIKYQIVNDGVILEREKWLDLSRYTVFGDCPREFTMSMKFMVNDKVNDGISILYFEDQKLKPVLKKVEGSSTLQLCLKDNNPINLNLNELYELRLHVAVTDVGKQDREDLKANLDYEILKTSNSESRGKLILKETYCGELRLVCLKNHSKNTSDNAFDIKGFRIYNTGTHVKLELFRTSDGVNVGRVNRNNPVDYEDGNALGVYNPRIENGGKLLCKVSWLNAEPDKKHLELVYYENGRPIESHFSLRGLDSECVDYNEDLISDGDKAFFVPGNSSGYFIFPFNTSDKFLGLVKFEVYNRVGNDLKAELLSSVQVPLLLVRNKPPRRY